MWNARGVTGVPVYTIYHRADYWYDIEARYNDNTELYWTFP